MVTVINKTKAESRKQKVEMYSSFLLSQFQIFELCAFVPSLFNG